MLSTRRTLFMFGGALVAAHTVGLLDKALGKVTPLEKAIGRIDPCDLAESKRLRSETPMIVTPCETCDFSKPFTIRWDDMNVKHIARWNLCVGTVEDDWNILSGEMGATLRAITLDLSHNKPSEIVIRLMYGVNNTSSGEVEEMRALVPLVIKGV